MYCPHYDATINIIIISQNVVLFPLCLCCCLCFILRCSEDTVRTTQAWEHQSVPFACACVVVRTMQCRLNTWHNDIMLWKLLSLSSSLMLLLLLSSSSSFIPFVSPYASPCQLPSTSDVIRQYSTLVKCCVYGNVLTHFPSKMWKTFSYVALVSRRELLFKHFCTMLFIQIQSRVFKYNHKSWKSITAR
jgi:hypothetical protein